MSEVTLKRDKLLHTFYGVGDFGFRIMISVGQYYQTFFLTDVAKLPLALMALVSTIPSIFDAVMSPVYGGLIDVLPAMRWGRIRSWLIATPWLMVIVYAFCYSKIGGPEMTTVILIVASILRRPLQNIPWSANAALILLISKNPEDTVLFSSRRSVWNSLGEFFFTATSVYIIQFFQNLTGSEVWGYTGLQTFGAVAMAVGFYIHFKLTEGYEELPVKGEAAKGTKKVRKERASVKELVLNVVKNPALLVLIIADYGSQISMFIGTATIAYFFKYVIEATTWQAVFMTAVSIALLVGSFITPAINKKILTKKTMILGAVVSGILGICGMFFVNSFFVFSAFYMLSKVGLAVVNSAKVALYAEANIYSEWKTGVNTSGFIMGLQTVATKIASLTRGIVFAFGLGAIGFVQGMEPTETLKSGLIVLSVLVPNIGMVLCGIIILFFYKLTPGRIQTMKEEIVARKVSI